MQPEDIDRELRTAIERRSIVTFVYADLIRVVEPHRYGINSAGHPMLSGWLRAGYSRSDPAGGWRNYLLNDIFAFQRLDVPFIGARPGYAPRDERMREVYAELPAPAPDMVPASQAPFVVHDAAARLRPVTPLADVVPHASGHPVEAARTRDGEGDAVSGQQPAGSVASRTP